MEEKMPAWWEWTVWLSRAITLRESPDAAPYRKAVRGFLALLADVDLGDEEYSDENE